MKYSIILPVYNAELTLRRCLDSLLRQPFADYELLLVNDGSTDGSAEICREYAAAYPQLRYIEKENGGVSSARNLALAQAQGEYILFVDSDDYVSERYFSVLEAALAQSDPDLLLFGYQNFGTLRSTWNTGNYLEREECAVAARVSDALRAYLFSSLWSKVFRRSIIDAHRLRFDTSLSIGEDQAFIFSYAMHIRSIASISDTLYYVDTTGQNSLSRKRRDYLTEQLLTVNRRMAAALHASQHTPHTQRQYEAALAWVFYRSAYSCCKELLKYDLTPKQRRSKIRDICARYRAEAFQPLGWKCRVIALPIQLGWSHVLDFMSNIKFK